MNLHMTACKWTINLQSNLASQYLFNQTREKTKVAEKLAVNYDLTVALYLWSKEIRAYTL